MFLAIFWGSGFNYREPVDCVGGFLAAISYAAAQYVHTTLPQFPFRALLANS